MGWVKQLGMRSGLAHRFIAGENVDEVLAVVRSLHDTGVMTTLNLLGEEVQGRKKADGAVRAYVELLRAIDRAGLKSQVSVKLSQLGLRISRKGCSAHLKDLPGGKSGTQQFRSNRYGGFPVHPVHHRPFPGTLRELPGSPGNRHPVLPV